MFFIILNRTRISVYNPLHKIIRKHFIAFREFKVTGLKATARPIDSFFHLVVCKSISPAVFIS